MYLPISKFARHSKNLSIYLMASLIPMALSVLVNPLISLNMSPTDFAVVGYYTAFNTLFTPFVTFYLTQYYTKRYFELDDENRLRLKSTIFRSLIYFSFVIALLSLVGLWGYTRLFNRDSDIAFLPYAVISVFSIPLTGIYTLTLIEYRMQRNSKAFFNLSVSNGVLSVAMILLLVVVVKLGATGKLLAAFFGSLFIYIYCIYANRGLFRYAFDWKILREALLFCLPLVVAAMLSFFSGGYDKVLLERTGSSVELGYYVVGFSIASYINVFVTSINDTFQPDVYQSIVTNQYRRCAKIIGVKIALIALVTVCFILAAPLLIRLLTAGRYIASTPYAVIISLSAVTSMMYHSFSQVTIAKGYTSVTLINKIVSSIACVFIYGALIRRFGAVGAAWGVVLSFLVFFTGNVLLFTIRYRLARKNT